MGIIPDLERRFVAIKLLFFAFLEILICLRPSSYVSGQPRSGLTATAVWLRFSLLHMHRRGGYDQFCDPSGVLWHVREIT